MRNSTCEGADMELTRERVAEMYLKGEGIEIGALHNALKTPESARVRYVDRMSVSELKKQYPELEGEELVEVDILDDGERLEKLEDSSGFCHSKSFHRALPESHRRFAQYAENA